MPEASPETVMHFEVHPSVLFKLGEDLITDDAQALVELIKNSYDADAQTIRVDIDTDHWFDRSNGQQVESPEMPDDAVVRGRLSVTDDGNGMDLEAIRSGWLTVSYSKKRLMKAAGQKTSRNRTPVGDKGLGRLGVQRLGQIVNLVSVPATPESELNGSPVGESRNRVLIDWERFALADKLTSVPLDVSTAIISKSASGTTVEVLGLHSLTYWEGSGELDLQKELTSILSPYDNAAGIRVFITINGAEIDLRREARRVLDAAPTQFIFAYAEGVLEITSTTSHSILRGRNPEDKAAYNQLIVPDGGYKFAEWLIKHNATRAEAQGVELGDDRDFLRYRKTVSLDDVVPAKVSYADPGPFSGEISSLSYDQSDDSAFDRTSDLREFAEGLAGIRVFRDGFGIRLNDDWLGLSKQQTTASSYYGLRPNNTAGYVNLTAEGNAALEETSSREAFRDTPAWQGFFGLMQQVVNFARTSQEFARRNWNTYKREHSAPTVLGESASPMEIAEHIEGQVTKVAAAQKRTTVSRKTLERLSDTVDGLIASQNDASAAIWADPAIQIAVEEAASSIRSAQRDLAATFDELDSIFRMMNELKGATSLLQEKVQISEQRLDNAWESVALGLSAELLAHEVDQIGERLRGRSHQILDYFKSNDPRDPRALAYAEHVRSSSAELLRQVARLNPSLRFRRDRKANLKVSTLLGAATEYHIERLSKARISLTIEVVRDFEIRINEGKFAQILDNLILNSEYWVRRHIQQGKIQEGKIKIVVDLPRISLTDNGPGVSPSVQASLFDAFVTTKPELQGRGLGLFVVTQLLDSEGGTIRLEEHTNVLGNPDTFDLDLRALLPQSKDESGGA